MADGHQQPIGLLVCQVRDRVCALPLAHVLETMRPQPLATIPGSPPYVCGLAMIRGEAIPTLDLACLMGLPGTASGRFITIQRHDHQHAGGKPAVALAVQAVHGVRQVAAAELHALPSLLRESDADLVSAISAKDAELLMVLDSIRLLSLTDEQRVGNDGPAKETAP